MTLDELNKAFISDRTDEGASISLTMQNEVLTQKGEGDPYELFGILYYGLSDLLRGIAKKAGCGPEGAWAFFCLLRDNCKKELAEEYKAFIAAKHKHVTESKEPKSDEGNLS